MIRDMRHAHVRGLDGVKDGNILVSPISAFTYASRREIHIEISAQKGAREVV